MLGWGLGHTGRQTKGKGKEDAMGGSERRVHRGREKRYRDRVREGWGGGDGKERRG